MNDKTYICSECNKLYNIKDVHMYIKNSLEKEKYICDNCLIRMPLTLVEEFNRYYLRPKKIIII
jgi:hypothetical protein